MQHRFWLYFWFVVILAVGLWLRGRALSETPLNGDEEIHRRVAAALLRKATLERIVIIGVITMLLGMILLALAVNIWRRAGFGDLDYEQTMRWVIPGCALTALGFETILAGFYFGILQFFRR